MSASFQVRDVEEIIDLMERWGIAEVRLDIEGSSLDLVRQVAPVAGAAPAAFPPLVPTAEEPELLEVEFVHAPAVGVFHLARKGFPHGTPEAGDQVQAGQIIGTLELMRVPNDLVSPVSGTIDSILADDGAGVEYGQPLMSIRPFEEVSEHEAGMLPPPR